MTTSSGIVGMTRKMFVTKLITSSTTPPMYAARMPSVVARTVARRRGRDAEEQRAARAEDDLREDVAPLVGGTEEVVPRRRLPGVEEAEARGVADRDERRDQRDHHHEQDQEEADARLGVAEQQLHPAGYGEPAARRPDRRPAPSAIVGWTCDI